MVAVSNRLREMGKIQKTDRWVPRELSVRQMEKRKCKRDKKKMYKKLMWQKEDVQIEVVFASYTLIGGEKGIYFENSKRKNHG